MNRDPSDDTTDQLSEEELAFIEQLVSEIGEEEPESRPLSPLLDISKDAGIGDGAVFIELSETKEPLDPKKKAPTTYSEYIRGLLSQENPIEEGKILRFYTTLANGRPNFGWRGFSTPISNVVKEGRYVYFHAEGKPYRIEFLHGGN